jgi:hypothetical protein
MRRHAAAARAGYQTTAPGEQAGMRERHARLGPVRVRRAPCWATGQPSRQGRRRGALRPRGVSDPCSPPTRVARMDEPGLDPCLFAGVGWGRRAVTRRRRRHRARLPGRRAARRARGHGCKRLSGWYTPVPSRDERINVLVLLAGRLPPADRAPATRHAAAAPSGQFVEHLECEYALNVLT